VLKLEVQEISNAASLVTVMLQTSAKETNLDLNASFLSLEALAKIRRKSRQEQAIPRRDASILQAWTANGTRSDDHLRVLLEA